MDFISLQQFGKPNDNNCILKSAVGSMSEQKNLLEYKKFCKTTQSLTHLTGNTAYLPTLYPKGSVFLHMSVSNFLEIKLASCYYLFKILIQLLFETNHKYSYCFFNINIIGVFDVFLISEVSLLRFLHNLFATVSI